MCGWPTEWFRDARVLVIGGTSGIGRAIAEGFLANGADVTVTGASLADVRYVAGSDLQGIALDVRDAGRVAEVVQGLGGLDHLVYCAGIIRRGAEHDPAVFSEVVDVNLVGAMRVATAAHPFLADRGGTITMIASMLSFFGGGLVPAYSASKGGIVQLAKSLAISYAPHGIRVNAIAPGWIATDLTRALRADADRNSAIIARTPLGRWGKPSDVSGSALFLASPLAGFITGAVLPVDGGYSSS
jgi:NAD(P)-dependent dehydrogenase (short-subunit alcohol dehydrogenase family)